MDLDSPSSNVGYRIVHELPGRVRLRIPALGRPGFEPEDIEDWMELLGAVASARANRGARTLVVDYRPSAGARTAVLNRLKAYSPPAENLSSHGARATPRSRPW